MRCRDLPVQQTATVVRIGCAEWNRMQFEMEFKWIPIKFQFSCYANKPTRLSMGSNWRRNAVEKNCWNFPPFIFLQAICQCTIVVFVHSFLLFASILLPLVLLRRFSPLKSFSSRFDEVTLRVMRFCSALNCKFFLIAKRRQEKCCVLEQRSTHTHTHTQTHIDSNKRNEAKSLLDEWCYTFVTM